MSASLARQMREHNSQVRSRIALLPTTTPDDPRLSRAKQLTHAYHTRQIDQCEALLSVVSDLRGKHVLLVKKETAVSVWVAPMPVPAMPEPEMQEPSGFELLGLLVGV
jgi:hypothetical protein